MLEFECKDVLSLTGRIVNTYLEHNQISPENVPALIEKIHGKFSELNGQTVHPSYIDARPVPEKLTPAVPIEKSITPEFIICLEDGMKLQMLKRHLQTTYNMTPEQYRAKWGLAPDYPMVAPNYAQMRSELAKKFGLGKKKVVPKKPAKKAKTAAVTAKT